MLKGILNRTRLILVREEVSLEQVRRAGVTNPRMQILPDMAFSFTPSSSKDAVDWIGTFGIEVGGDTPVLGITAISWGAQTGQHTLQTQYETALAGAIRHFIEHMGGKAVFFPQVTGAAASADDRLPARRVIACLSDLNGKVILIDPPPAPAVLKAAYGLMDVFIGTRMHSNIFALSASVPVLAIAYRHKTQGIMHMLGLDEWCLEIGSASEAVLIQRLSDLWEQRDLVRSRIQKALPPVIEASRRAGILIAEDFTQTG
jgi:colanic acid/amylovoran biosynthesis protein